MQVYFVSCAIFNLGQGVSYQINQVKITNSWCSLSDDLDNMHLFDTDPASDHYEKGSDQLYGLEEQIFKYNSQENLEYDSEQENSNPLYESDEENFYLDDTIQYYGENSDVEIDENFHSEENSIFFDSQDISSNSRYIYRSDGKDSNQLYDYNEKIFASYSDEEHEVFDSINHNIVGTRSAHLAHSKNQQVLSIATTQTIKIDIKTLRAISSNEKEFKIFMAMHFQHLDRRQIQQVSHKVQHLVQLYQELKQELIYIRDNLPQLISELKHIKDKINGVHKRSQLTSVTAKIGSIIGGLCTIAGLVAAPFTGGASTPLAIAGTIIGTACGSAFAANKMIAGNKCTAYRKAADTLVEDMKSHYNDASTIYNELWESCQTLGDEMCSLCPELSKQFDKENMLGFVWSVCGLIYKPTTGIYSATKVATAPVKHAQERKQIATGFAKIISQVLSGNVKEIIKDYAMPTFQSLMTIMKSAGYIGTAASVAIDVVNALMIAKKVATKDKHKASQDVATKIQQLEEIERKMQTLQQHIQLDDG